MRPGDGVVPHGGCPLSWLSLMVVPCHSCPSATAEVPSWMSLVMVVPHGTCLLSQLSLMVVPRHCCPSAAPQVPDEQGAVRGREQAAAGGGEAAEVDGVVVAPVVLRGARGAGLQAEEALCGDRRGSQQAGEPPLAEGTGTTSRERGDAAKGHPPLLTAEANGHEASCWGQAQRGGEVGQGDLLDHLRSSKRSTATPQGRAGSRTVLKGHL